jgi:hypothetical protein
MRPSSREQSSNRYGDERSPRPARPRLNRESVDRAWESGAPSHHADYRTRSNNGNRGQAPRNDWRNDRPNGQFGPNRQGGQYPARNSRPSYGDRPGNGPTGPRRFDNTSNGNHSYQSNQRPPSRPFNGPRPYRPDGPDRPDRPYGNSRPDSTPRGNGGRPEYREHSRPYEPRPSYRSNEQGGGFQRRGTNYNERTERDGRYEHNERGPRQFEHNNYGNAGNYNGRPTRPPQSFDRDRHAPGNNYRDTRSPRDADSREMRDTQNTQNPRWLSRPAAQRDSSNRQEQNDFQSPPGQPGRERYKGDYERFNGDEDKPRFAGRPSLRYEKSKPRRPEVKKPRPEVEERHVTPLPDGRVLKGPRPVQRKNAEFWTGIAQNTDELLDGVTDVSTSQEQAADGSVVEHALPTNDSPAVEMLPTSDSVEAQEMPANDSPAVETLPTNDSVEAQETSANDNPEMQTLLPDGSIEAQEMPANDSSAVQEQTVAEEGTLPVKAKPRNRATSAAARSKKKETQAKTSGPKPQPSRRGFKWPTP